MRKTILVVAVAFLLLAYGNSAIADHGTRSGDNNGCLDMFLFSEEPFDGQDSPLAETFGVHENTEWEATGSADYVHVEFYDSSGNWLGHGDNEGEVPDGAEYGIACALFEPFIPDPLGTWRYNDG